MTKWSRIWIFSVATVILSSGNIIEAKDDFKKTGELYYKVFRNNDRSGYAHTEYYEATRDKVKWLRIIHEEKEEISGWFSTKTSSWDHTTILLKNNRFFSMKSKGEKDKDPYEVEIKTGEKGLSLVIMAQKKVKEGFIRFSDYDYTSVDSPYLYLKQYNTPYNLNILNLADHEVIRYKITLMRKEKMEARQTPFDCWVVRIDSPQEKRTNWVTPDGFLIQASGFDKKGSFLIKATSKENALAGY